MPLSQKPMYHTMINSPIAKLVNPVAAADTLITIDTPSSLPAAPNLFTIIDGVNSETVLYTNVSDGVYTCQRGFQGTAKDWPAGKKVARLFTSYDYEVLMDNVTDVVGAFSGDLMTPEAVTELINTTKAHIDEGQITAAMLTSELDTFISNKVDTLTFENYRSTVEGLIAQKIAEGDFTSYWIQTANEIASEITGTAGTIFKSYMIQKNTEILAKVESTDYNAFVLLTDEKFQATSDSIDGVEASLLLTDGNVSALASDVSGHTGLINVNSEKIAIVVNDDKTLKTASIVTAINEGISKIQMKAMEIDLSGLVVFHDEAGTSFIDGASIKTGTLDVQNIVNGKGTQQISFPISGSTHKGLLDFSVGGSETGENSARFGLTNNDGTLVKYLIISPTQFAFYEMNEAGTETVPIFKVDDVGVYHNGVQIGTGGLANDGFGLQGINVTDTDVDILYDDGTTGGFTIVKDTEGNVTSIENKTTGGSVYLTNTSYALSSVSSLSVGTIASDSIQLTWVQPTAESYQALELYRSTTSLIGKDYNYCKANCVKVMSGRMDDWNNTGLTPNTTYYYQIFCRYLIGEVLYYGSGARISAATLSS